MPNKDSLRRQKDEPPTGSDMRKTILKIAKSVLDLPTAPFREHAVRDFIVAFCRARGIAVRRDDMGNLLVTYGSRFRGDARVIHQRVGVNRQDDP